eukprot:symbB.v1.2.039209.t1/scaffold6410.1/size18337/2
MSKPKPRLVPPPVRVPVVVSPPVFTDLYRASYGVYGPLYPSRGPAPQAPASLPPPVLAEPASAISRPRPTSKPSEKNHSKARSARSDVKSDESIYQQRLWSESYLHQERQKNKEKTLQELAVSQTRCQEEFVYVKEEPIDDIEKVTKRNRSDKRARSPQKRPPPPKTKRQQHRRGRKASSRFAGLDGKRRALKIPIEQLRYSQLSCKNTFQCGRPISELVNGLLTKKLSVNEPFLRLTVFETTDEDTHEVVLRCIDNRRLFALKEFAARKSGDKHLMVNVNLFSLDTLNECYRFIQNSDRTPGHDVQLRYTRRKWQSR